MAKQPETVDHFRLTINRLTPQQLGVVIADLAKREIFDIRPELITDVVTFRKNKPNKPKKKQRAPIVRKLFDKNASDVILAHARKHGGKFNTQQLLPVFAKQDRARNSIYATLDTLMKDKLIKRTGKGEYLLLAKGNGAAEAAHG
jgi:hypothetical protein